MKYFFETYGCQMNIAESAAAEQKLILRGWERAKSAKECDLAILNTCSVRATAENRIFGRLGFFMGQKSERKTQKSGIELPIVLVLGCMAERLKDSLKKNFHADYVLGTFDRPKLESVFSEIEQILKANDENPQEILAKNQNKNLIKIFSQNKNENSSKNQSKNSLKNPRENSFQNQIKDSTKNQQENFQEISSKIQKNSCGEYFFDNFSLEPGAFSSFVPIMNGCDNFCTYCIVPFTRGREISRNIDSIFFELEELSKRQVREITLLGQNVNSFSKIVGEKTIFFPELLQKIADFLASKNSSIKWIRFLSSHPKDFKNDLLSVIKNNPVFCPQIHLPLQSGSSEILQKMNRKYSREEYLSLVQKIRSVLPDCALTTDIMVGFPGESDFDFMQTMDFVRRVRFSSAFMYYYNPREGTIAQKMPNQIPVSEKKRRLKILIDEQLKITREEMQKQIGKIVRVLVERKSKNSEKEFLGRTARDERIVFEGEKRLIGNFLDAKILGVQGNTFRAKIVTAKDIPNE